MTKADEMFDAYIRETYGEDDQLWQEDYEQFKHCFLSAHAAQQITIDEQAGEIRKLREALTIIANGVAFDYDGYQVCNVARTALMAGEEGV